MPPQNNKEKPLFTCPFCSYTFKKRVENPKKCPACQKWLHKPKPIKFILIPMAILIFISTLYADNCYVLDGFPADQARCVQQAQQQQNNIDRMHQQFQQDNANNTQAMNTAILLDQLRIIAQKNQPIDPNHLPEIAPIQ